MLTLLRTATRRGFIGVPCTTLPSRSPPSLRWATQQLRRKSTITHHSAAADAPREVPTPLVLLSAAKWSGEGNGEQSMSAFIKHFTAQGWNVASIDLDPEQQDGTQGLDACTTSADVLARLEAELAAQMRTANASGGSPFPPLLAANGLATLVAESYVSSHPLSGLALLDPPLSPNAAHEQHPDKLPTAPDAFTYELRFPCVVAWSTERAKELAFWDVHRIEEAREDEADEALDRFVWDMQQTGEDERAGPYQLRKWAEDNGIAVDGVRQDELDVAEGEAKTNESNEGEVQEEKKKNSSKDKPASRYKPPPLPEWYSQGQYVRNPDRQAKKMPLFVDEKHLNESFIRGSGPGGQAINKLATCVQLKHVPTGMVIRCQDTRSRAQNRINARRKMSRELERVLFGERDSVLGREAAEVRRKEHTKARKQRRNKEAREEEEKEKERMKDWWDD